MAASKIFKRLPVTIANSRINRQTGRTVRVRLSKNVREITKQVLEEEVDIEEWKRNETEYEVLYSVYDVSECAQLIVTESQYIRLPPSARPRKRKHIRTYSPLASARNHKTLCSKHSKNFLARICKDPELPRSATCLDRSSLGSECVLPFHGSYYS
jgi:hypothetical protein